MTALDIAGRFLLLSALTGFIASGVQFGHPMAYFLFPVLLCIDIVAAAAFAATIWTVRATASTGRLWLAPLVFSAVTGIAFNALHIADVGAPYWWQSTLLWIANMAVPAFAAWYWWARTREPHVDY
ncbi:hypothetical protein [Gulosibacter sp. 10]|uniref:hypothetical protein n=1 Tax=Gulosibacter sp. 10 TaxID=1255570 RepID=UPI00097EE208|nr:hypothetical protein [Gulosibacter sp. 10]SJM66346.1 hypothetical protein FM112_11695 [Gulosibacter sp. 10]